MTPVAPQRPTERSDLPAIVVTPQDAHPDDPDGRLRHRRAATPLVVWYRASEREHQWMYRHEGRRTARSISVSHLLTRAWFEQVNAAVATTTGCRDGRSPAAGEVVPKREEVVQQGDRGRRRARPGSEGLGHLERDPADRCGGDHVEIEPLEEGLVPLAAELRHREDPGNSTAKTQLGSRKRFFFFFFFFCLYLLLLVHLHVKLCTIGRKVMVSVPSSGQPRMSTISTSRTASTSSTWIFMAIWIRA